MTPNAPVPLHKAIARPVAAVLGGLAAAMALCAVVGLAFDLSGRSRPGVDEGGVVAMAIAAVLTGCAAGGTLFWAGRQEVKLGRREAVAAVTSLWIAISGFGGLPFVLEGELHPVDAFFEAASGFTTTGATVVTDIEHTLSKPLLLWRSLMQWIGGMGVVVLFVAIFPNLGVSGKHMFRSEVPGVTADGLSPRITETSIALWRLYAALTAANGLMLWFAGMAPFEALCHALTTLSTGGFSTRDASVLAFDSAAIEYITAAFMLIAAMNFALLFAWVQTRRWSVFSRSSEFRAYVFLVAFAVIALTIAVLPLHELPELAFRRALFTVATTISSTGFATDTYMDYSGVGLFLMLSLMFVGGCAGSTAGGLKVARLVLLFETARAMVRRNVRPAVVQVVRLDKKVVDQEVLLEVSGFFFLFVATLAAGILMVCWLDGVRPETAFGAMLSCLSNMGPAPYFQEADNFAGYSSASKLIFSLAMITGRLEFFTVFALLLPELWRR